MVDVFPAFQLDRRLRHMSGSVVILRGAWRYFHVVSACFRGPGFTSARSIPCHCRIIHVALYYTAACPRDQCSSRQQGGGPGLISFFVKTHIKNSGK